MTALRFNPLTNAEKLKSLGMDANLATEIAQQQEELVNSELFTKQEGSILKQDLLNEIKNMELRMYKALFAMFVAFEFIQHFIK